MKLFRFLHAVIGAAATYFAWHCHTAIAKAPTTRAEILMTTFSVIFGSFGIWSFVQVGKRPGPQKS